MTEQASKPTLRTKKRVRELPAKDLRWKCNPSLFAVKTTKEAEPWTASWAATRPARATPPPESETLKVFRNL